MQADTYEPRVGVTSDEVASHIMLPHRNLPTIFLAIAPCRTGTTTQLRVFGVAGMQAHYQPLKATLRRLMHNMYDDFLIPAGDQLFIKETIGPYTDTEARFNPVEVLLKAGYPPEKIILIPEMREPLSALASWQEQFSFNRSKDILFQNCVTAYGSVMDAYSLAQNSGIFTSAYVYEVQRDNPAGLGIERLFGRIGLPYSDACVEGWQNLPPFGMPGSNIFFALEPPLYSARNFHATASSATRLDYFGKSPRSIDAQITLAQVQVLMAANVPQMYEALRTSASAELGLTVRPSHEVSDFLTRNP